MKKSLKINKTFGISTSVLTPVLTLALTFAFASLPVVSFAQDGHVSGPNSASVSVSASTTVDANKETPQSHSPKPGLIKDIIQTIHTGIQAAREDMHNGRGTDGQQASTTPRDSVMASSTNPGPHGEIKMDIKNIHPEVKAEIKGDVKMMKIVMMARDAWTRINATVDRLTKIDAKLDTRITKIKTAGSDTTVAEGFSANAKTSLAKATADLADAKTLVSGISSTTALTLTASSTVGVSMKADAQDAEVQVKAAQTAIGKALQSLEALHLKTNVQ